MPPKKLKQAKAKEGKAKTKKADEKDEAAGEGGGKIELKDGLVQDLREKGGGVKELWFINNTRDKQFILGFDVKGDKKAGPEAKDEGDKITLSVHPGEELMLCSGKFTKFLKKKLAGGPPDPKWVAKMAEKSSGKVEQAVERVKQALKKRGVTKVTAEATASACQEEGIEFVDVTFLPRQTSMIQPWINKKMKEYAWRRPSDYLSDMPDKEQRIARLFVGNIEPNDIDQGALADCYLMGALASVGEFEHLVRALFENGQDPDLGLYRVSICKNGWWQTVVVDDFFPMSGPKPAFARNRDEPNELWVTLTEKAYAKLHGSFGAIMTGSAAASLGDLTGCPYKTFEFGAADNEGSMSFQELLENDQNDFLQVLGTPGRNIMGVEDSATPAEKQMWDKYTAQGLICEHSYSLITVTKTATGGHELCKLRNPWGNDKEWTGKWSDDDKSWTPALKKEVGHVASDDGTFWMQYSDVVKWFSSISICYTYRTWDQIRIAGNWEKGASDLALKIVVKETCRIFFGVSQKDSRGCKPGTADAKLDPMDLWAVKQGKKGPLIVVQRGTKMRDVFQCEEVQKGTEITMLAQPKEASLTKSFVLSLLIEEGRERADIFFLTGKNKRYGGPKEFDFGHWKNTEANYQIKGEWSTNACVVRRQGKNVRWEGARDEALQAEQALFRKYVANDAKKPDVPADAKKLHEYEITMHGGKGLVAMDDCGTSDPFCEVKLRSTNKAGELVGSHRCPQKRITNVCWKTLSPKWNESMHFLATAADAVKINCFDMDDVGKDSLGKVEIKLGDIMKKAKPGGPAVTADYKLVKEYPTDTPKGTLNISIKCLK